MQYNSTITTLLLFSYNGQANTIIISKLYLSIVENRAWRGSYDTARKMTRTLMLFESWWACRHYKWKSLTARLSIVSVHLKCNDVYSDNCHSPYAKQNVDKIVSEMLQFPPRTKCMATPLSVCFFLSLCMCLKLKSVQEEDKHILRQFSITSK